MLGVQPVQFGVDEGEALRRDEVRVRGDGTVGKILEGLPALLLANEGNANETGNARDVARVPRIESAYAIVTTVRPRVRPARISGPRSITPASGTVVVIAESAEGSRSRASRAQASRRKGSGAITLSIP